MTGSAGSTRLARHSSLPLLIVVLSAFSTLFAAEPGMKLTSPAFTDDHRIPATYTCDGEGSNPPLLIEGVPKEAKSLALVLDDPDAPAGVWVHWVLWNIDPGTRKIPKGSVPPGAEQGENSWKAKSYGGPCPPSGTHRYFFRLYALKERLSLSSKATRDDLDRAMQGKIVARSELLGRYSRSRSKGR